jgi:hypothetical protein
MPRMALVFILIFVMLPSVAMANHGRTIPVADGLVIKEYSSNVAHKYPYLNNWPAPALIFGLGEITGLRDIQGGQIVEEHPQLNALSIGAGNASHPGRLELGSDVTRSVAIHVKMPGRRPKKMIEISPRKGIVIYGPVTFKNRVRGMR